MVKISSDVLQWKFKQIVITSIVISSLQIVAVDGVCQQRLADNGTKILILNTNESTTFKCPPDFEPPPNQMANTAMCMSDGQMFSWTVCKNSCTTNVENGQLVVQGSTGDFVPYNGTGPHLGEEVYVQCDQNYIFPSFSGDTPGNIIVTCVENYPSDYTIFHKKLLCTKECNLSAHLANTDFVFNTYETWIRSKAFVGIPYYVTCAAGEGFLVPGNPSIAFLECGEDKQIHSFAASNKCRKYQQSSIVMIPGKVAMVYLGDSFHEVVLGTDSSFAFDASLSKSHCGTYQNLVIYIEGSESVNTNNVHFFDVITLSWEHNLDSDDASNVVDPSFKLTDENGLWLGDEDSSGRYFSTLFGGPYKNIYLVCCAKSLGVGLKVLIIDASSDATGTRADFIFKQLPDIGEFNVQCGAVRQNWITIIGNGGDVKLLNFETSNVRQLPKLVSLADNSCVASWLDARLYVCSPETMLCYQLLNYLVVNEAANVTTYMPTWIEYYAFGPTSFMLLATTAFAPQKRSLSVISEMEDTIVYNNLASNSNSQLQYISNDAKCVTDASFKPYLGPALIFIGGKPTSATDSTPANDHSTREVAIFYPEHPTESHLFQAKMLTPRYHAACMKKVDAAQELICCGGKSLESGEVLRSCERLKLTHGLWVPEPDSENTFTTRHYHSFFVRLQTGEEYLCGGLDSFGRTIPGCKSEPEPEPDSLPTPSFVRRLPCGSGAEQDANDYMLLFGGTDIAGGISNRVDHFDGSTWTTFSHGTSNAYHYCSAKTFSFEAEKDVFQKMVLVCGFKNSHDVTCERFLPKHPGMGFHAAGNYSTSDPTPMEPGNIQIDVGIIHTDESTNYNVIYAQFGKELVKYDLYLNEWSSIADFPDNLGVQEKLGWNLLVFEHVQDLDRS